MKIKYKPTPRKLTEEQKESIRKKMRQRLIKEGSGSTGDIQINHNVPLVTPNKVKNITKAAGRIVGAVLQGHPVKVSDEEKEHRLAICRGCDLWNEGGNRGLGECQHEKCGCTRFKHGLATETCPLGKW